ncbi:MAG: glycosyltransferase family 39 protein [Candidatus Eisenbacteria bacterium]
MWPALAAGVVLRFWKSGTPGLWVDEGFTAKLAATKAAAILEALRRDDAPPLFYLLEKAMTWCFGDSEAALRLLPALASALATWMAVRIARRWFPSAVAGTALVFAFSTPMIFYAHQARGYGLIHLLVLVLVYATLGYLERPTMARGAGIAVTSSALLFVHNLGIAPAVTAVAIASWSGLRRRPPGGGGRTKRSLLLIWSVFALSALVFVIGIGGYVGNHRELNSWMGVWWQGRSLALAPFFSAMAFTNGGAGALDPPVPLPTIPDRLAWARFGVFAAVAIGLALGCVRTKTPARVLAAFVAVPIATLIAACLFIGPTYVVGRTDMFALPPFLLFVAVGWSSVRTRIPVIGFLAVWLLGAALCLAGGSEAGIPKESDRALARWIGARIEAGDAVVAAPLGKPTLEYYGRRQEWLDRTTGIRSFPALLDANPAGLVATPTDSLWSYLAEARVMRAGWERDGVGSVWVEAVLRDPTEAWPQLPTAPGPEARTITVDRLAYPGSLVVFTLRGLEPTPVSALMRRDWVDGDRVLLRIPRTQWVPLDSLPTVQ